MFFTDAQLRAVAAILYDVRTSDTIKLRWGREKRDQLRDAEKRGDKLDGYRAEWLKSCRHEVLMALSKSAEDFNEKYPHDRISTQDFIDVLSGTARALVRAQKDIKDRDQSAPE